MVPDTSAGIELVAAVLGVDRSNAIQIIVVSAGTLASFLAAFSAWLAARSTKHSVNEMRRARVQQVTPVLGIIDPPRAKLVWSDGKSTPKITFIEPDGSKSEKSGITLSNKGFGTAIDIHFDFKWDEMEEAAPGDLTELARFLAAGNVSVKTSNFGVALTGVDEERPFRWLKTPPFDGLTSENCAPKESTEIDLPIDLYLSYTFRNFVRTDRETNSYSWILPFTLSYSTIAQERVSEDHYLMFSEVDMGLRVGDPPDIISGVPHWSELHTTISVHVARKSKFKDNIFSAIYDRHIHGMFNPARLLGDWIDATHQKASGRIRYGKDFRVFKVGDQVRLKLDSDWIDGETVVPPEQSTPLASLIAARDERRGR